MNFLNDNGIGRMIFDNANEAWEKIYVELNKHGFISSPRGFEIKEFIDSDIIIKNPMDCIVTSKYRKLSARYLAAEWLWYLSGDNSVESISQYSKFWENIQNDDGTVNSNYGSYIFKNGEWEKIVKLLKDDPDSRQALLQIPITKNIGSKDTPCTSSIQFFLRNNKLYMTVYMRSNDIWLGFPFDVHCFSMMQIKLAKELGVELGYYRHLTGSIHLYTDEYYGSKKGVIDIDEMVNNFDETIDNSDKSTDEYMNDLIKCRDKNYEEVKNESLRTLLINSELIKG